jgi:hypothetical protein
VVLSVEGLLTMAKRGASLYGSCVVCARAAVDAGPLFRIFTNTHPLLPSTSPSPDLHTGPRSLWVALQSTTYKFGMSVESSTRLDGTAAPILSQRTRDMLHPFHRPTKQPTPLFQSVSHHAQFATAVARVTKFTGLVAPLQKTGLASPKD